MTDGQDVYYLYHIYVSSICDDEGRGQPAIRNCFALNNSERGGRLILQTALSRGLNEEAEEGRKECCGRGSRGGGWSYQGSPTVWGFKRRCASMGAVEDCDAPPACASAFT